MTTYALLSNLCGRGEAVVLPEDGEQLVLLQVSLAGFDRHGMRSVSGSPAKFLMQPDRHAMMDQLPTLAPVCKVPH